MSLDIAFIAETGCTVGAGESSIELSDTAVLSPYKHRSHAAALIASDIADGEGFVYAVEKDNDNRAIVTGQFVDGTPDTISVLSFDNVQGSIVATDTVTVALLSRLSPRDRVFTNTGNTIRTVDGEVHLIDMAGGARDFSSGMDIPAGGSVLLEISSPASNGITWAAGEFVGDFDFSALTGKALVAIYHNGTGLVHVFCGEAV